MRLVVRERTVTLGEVTVAADMAVAAALEVVAVGAGLISDLGILD